MIPVTKIISQVESMLDAEGFDHYAFDEDYKPAINYAQDWITQLYSRLMSERKFSEEMLRELTYIRVWYTSIYSRLHLGGIGMTDIGGQVWTVLGVYPEPETAGTWTPPVQDSAISYLTTLLYKKSRHSAFKTNFERSNLNISNPFENGNEVIQGDLRSYGYIPIVNYGVFQEIREIQITPDYPTQYVAVAYLLQPTDITATTDNIKFPKTLLPLIVNKTAQFISTKQGDRTNLYSVTGDDINSLIQLTT